jgi:hypothetical protein
MADVVTTAQFLLTRDTQLETQRLHEMTFETFSLFF